MDTWGLFALTKLRHLRLGGQNVADDGIMVSRLTDLQTLRFTERDTVAGPVLESISRLPKLGRMNKLYWDD